MCVCESSLESLQKGAYAYQTPRGKFEMVQYQLKQYTPLHLTGTAGESHLSGDALSYCPSLYTSLGGFRKASACDEA